MNKKEKTAPSKISKKAKKNKREEYIDELTSRLKKWDRELAEFEEKSEQRKARIKATLSEKIDNLKARRQEIREKIARLEDAGEDAFKNVKSDIENLWKDIKKGIGSIKKRVEK